MKQISGESVIWSPGATWTEDHAGELEQYRGEWILVDGSGVLAHGEKHADVSAVADRKGIKIPFIIRVPEDAEAIFMGL